ncbi:acylphosphatase [Fusibacter sp. JL216-2]|uniref:acylphosphatase n=1 Tax=Fusibacter sp. JL216-2 TaxID=3071453 RepID=UPI003D34E68D
MKTYHIAVKGRVQGVGYRYFTFQKAQSLGVKGWVRNLADGRVEIMVSGQEDVLEIFVEALKAGPAFARVDAVSVLEEPKDLDNMQSAFVIK